MNVTHLGSGTLANVEIDAPGDRPIRASSIFRRTSMAVTHVSGIDQMKVARPERFELPTPWFVG